MGCELQKARVPVRSELAICRNATAQISPRGLIPLWLFLFSSHIEGKQGMQNIVELPDDLLEDLPMLTLLQLGNHPTCDGYQL